MRILYFSRDYCPHDHRFLTAMVDAGNEVYYLRLEDSGRKLESREIPAQVEKIEWRGTGKRFNPWSIASYVLDLKQVLQVVKPDILHAGPIQSVGLIAALSGFHPLLSMSWGFDLMQNADRTPWSRWVTRNVLAKSDWLFGDCRAVLNKAADYGYDLKRSTYFPWGVDLDNFAPGENNRLSEQLNWKDAFIFLSNRSWEPQYGADIVAKAFVDASAVNPRIRLLMPGSGSQAGLIHQIFAEAGLLDKVHLPGQVKFADLPDLYRSADCYLSASHTDGSSVSLMEALACGLPVIVSDIAGNMEWVTPGEQGWLFPDGDAHKLADLMVKASQSRVDQAVMSLKSRHKAEQFANWKINQQRMQDGYLMLLRKQEGTA